MSLRLPPPSPSDLLHGDEDPAASSTPLPFQAYLTVKVDVAVEVEVAAEVGVVVSSTVQVRSRGTSSSRSVRTLLGKPSRHGPRAQASPPRQPFVGAKQPRPVSIWRGGRRWLSIRVRQR
jgi:hypothetical protein